MIYVDNANHLGLSPGVTERSREELSKSLNAHGLATHETLHATTRATSLGALIAGDIKLVAPTPERDGRLDSALLGLINGVRVNSDDMRRVAGHITCVLLLKRPLLSCLHYIYSFMNAEIVHPVRLWPAVVLELRLVRALLVFCFSDLAARYATTVTISDACLSGYGVSESEWEFEEVFNAASNDERWRFKASLTSTKTHRERVLVEYKAELERLRNLDVLNDIDSVKPSGDSIKTLLEDYEFPNIPVGLLTENWKDLYGAPLRFREAVHMCEARGALSAVKHRTRDRNFHGKRCLFLGDNLGLVLALQKGRCSCFPLLKLLRRTAAELLASGIVAYFRWVPSEYNFADRISRLWEDARLAEEGHGRK